MKFKKYLQDKLYFLLSFLIMDGFLLLMFLAFKIDASLIRAVFFILFFFFFFVLLFEYYRKKGFYTNLLHNIEQLDQAYLVLETLVKPEFYDGELMYQALYEINKSMIEKIQSLQIQEEEFKEYIELWIHEVKIPLATLLLMSNNHKDSFDKKIKLQLKRLEDYVDQVLYYARSEHAEQDYLVKETNLSKVIKNVGLKNMEDLLENQIDYIVDRSTDVFVLTDSKWLEFILGQIINNSIKYKKNIDGSYIKIHVQEDEDKIILVLLDNGIGIKESDLKRVFDQTFTGENGRTRGKSTGMGLFLCKKMCEKLGHTIALESVEGEYTRVSISFAKDKYYEVLK